MRHIHHANTVKCTLFQYIIIINIVFFVFKCSVVFFAARYIHLWLIDDSIYIWKLHYATHYNTFVNIVQCHITIPWFLSFFLSINFVAYYYLVDFSLSLARVNFTTIYLFLCIITIGMYRVHCRYVSYSLLRSQF